MFNLFFEKIIKNYFAAALLVLILIINIISFALKDYSNAIVYFSIVTIFLSVLIIIQKLIKVTSKNNLKFREILFMILVVIFIVRILISIIIPYENSKKVIGKTYNLELKIISVNSADSSNFNYENIFLQIYSENTETKNQSTKKTILASSKYGRIIIYGHFKDLNQGDVIRAEIKFSSLHPARNPGGFDEKKYYFGKGVFMRGNIDENNYKLTGSRNKFIYNKASFFRFKIKETFNYVLPKNEAGLLTGIILGDRSGISNSEKDNLYNAGLSHITAISGAAISFLVFPLKFIMKKMKIQLYVRYIIIVLFLIITGTIAFWTPSVTRAILMVVSIMTAGILIRKINAYQSLILSALIILFFNPYMLYSAGFILSFCTVSGIFIFYKIIKNKIENKYDVSNIISSALAINISACISSFPAAMYLFNEISLTSLISNFLVMPLFQIAVTCGFIMALSGILNFPLVLISLLAVPVKGILVVINYLASIISDFQFLKFKTGFISVVFLIGIICIFYSLLQNDKFRRKILILIACFCMICNTSYYFIIIQNQPDVTIVFADVGQGDATLIIYKDKTSILIDSGSRRNSVKILNEIMNYYKIDYPSIYIATHMHEDHCGAMPEIITQRGGEILFVPEFTHEDIIDRNPDFNGYYKEFFSTDISTEVDLIHGFELLSAAYNLDLKIVETGCGDSYKICNVSEIAFLSPPKEDYDGREKGGNESSLVTLFDYNGFRFLIMGDATQKDEDRILKSNNDIQSDVYRISHHGSPTSTNHDIIDAVSAKVSIISVGYNFYGHPSDDVITRLEESGSIVYRTDLHGALIFEIKGNKMRYKTMLEN